MTEKAAKINELSGKGIEKVEYIKPYYQNDSKVLKITDAKGREKYCGYYADNEELRTGDAELEIKLLCLLEPLEILEKALAYEGYNYEADTLTAIRQNITNKIDEIFQFVNNNIGVIKIYEIYEIESGRPYRWGQCVDAKLSPPDTSEDGEKGPIYDHDPELIESLKQIRPDKTETIKTIIRHIKHGNKIQFHVVRD
ncbi:MAG: hypothetical protein ABFD75_07475 [Smithella sp.]